MEQQIEATLSRPPTPPAPASTTPLPPSPSPIPNRPSSPTTSYTTSFPNSPVQPNLPLSAVFSSPGSRSASGVSRTGPPRSIAGDARSTAGSSSYRIGRRSSLRFGGLLGEAVAAANGGSRVGEAGSVAGLSSLGTGREQGKDEMVLEVFGLYETKTKLYVVASSQADSRNHKDSRYRVLKIDRTHTNEEDGGLNITEDSAVYSKAEIDELLETLSAGNAGGVKKVVESFYGIAGFVRFTGTYYMILIVARTAVALLGGHYIYHCDDVVLRPISASSGSKSAQEARLHAAFLSVDLSRNFYFSYTYDITHTLQHNLTLPIHDPSASAEPAPPQPPSSTRPNPDASLTSFNEKWVWNHHLLKPGFRGSKGKSLWALPLIHGFVDQAKLSVYGKTIYLTLIARRSRHFAGARFLKRGVNEQGYVANDVETEQIVSEALTTSFHSPAPGKDANGNQARKLNPRYTSFVQVRGSIPLYWSQESNNMSPKPPIELTIVDPYFSAAALHFDDLLSRYGGTITVLNLIKQKERAPRESKLLKEFKECIDYLNQFLPAEQKIIYIPWDISEAHKHRDKDVISILEDIAEVSLEQTHFFHTGPEPNCYALNTDPDSPPYRSTPLLQSGVTRTNCIDCLDRTNAAQFVIAKAALGHQLHALGIIHHPRLPFDSDAVNLITEMFHDHGDTIALQYAGSHLVNTMQTYRKIDQWKSHSRTVAESVRRYINNSFVDADKQAAIDLFLGVSSHPSPTLPTWDSLRRSYRNWFDPNHLDSAKELALTESRLMERGEEKDVSWEGYYRPRFLTVFERLFAFKINSTDKYNTMGPSAERSPFVTRLAAPNASARLNVGGVRRWMSHRALAKSSLGNHVQSHQQGGTDDSFDKSASDLTKNTTESLVMRLLDPLVDPDEEQEYSDYIRQFESLDLGQLNSLSDKDVETFYSVTGLARGEGNLGIDSKSLGVYEEMVRIANSSRMLRGSEMGS